ncbi:MAG: extracellular solute-binding protein [Candidatus Methylacidiphilales bacterium]|nr:extracellular solute-binding protein [Candidatus Methylacidiphilales bacterium]
MTIPCHSIRAQDELIIVSPHWEGIQYEFGVAFPAWYQARTGRSITVRWRDMGGTSQIEKALDATYKATPHTCGIDVFFGGGIDPFESQKAKGQLAPFKLPDEILREIPTHIGGFPIVDPDFTFYGAALSSFGILENRRVTRTVGLPPVETWEDLGQPALEGWVSSADPRKSGSVHMIYEIILQAYGWEKGWDVIYRMSGNVKSFLQTSSSPTKEVTTGDAAYAVSIDINGMTQQAFVGKDNVRFTIPRGVSVINPDGIAILKGAPHRDAAEAFLIFAMSAPGQNLWMKPTGSPGGATRFGITRMGVLPRDYQGDLTDLLVPLNPFAIDYPFHYDSPMGSKRWNVVNALIGQGVIDVHSHLRAAWRHLLTLPEPLRGPALAEFTRPLISEAEATELAAVWRKDKLRARRLENEWMARSVERFKKLSAVSPQPSANKTMALKLLPPVSPPQPALAESRQPTADSLTP